MSTLHAHADLFSTLLRATKASTIASALRTLAALVDESEKPALALCDSLRQHHLVERLCAFVAHEDQAVRDGALLILGNITADVFDANAAETRAIVRGCGGYEIILRQLLSSDDATTLLYACGAAANAFYGAQEMHAIMSLNLLPRLMSLSTNAEPTVAGMATALVQNFQCVPRRARLGRSKPARCTVACIAPLTVTVEATRKRTSSASPLTGFARCRVAPSSG